MKDKDVHVAFLFLTLPYTPKSPYGDRQKIRVQRYHNHGYEYLHPFPVYWNSLIEAVGRCQKIADLYRIRLHYGGQCISYKPGEKEGQHVVFPEQHPTVHMSLVPRDASKPTRRKQKRKRDDGDEADQDPVGFYRSRVAVK